MDVAAWLRGLGLEQYAPAFRDNDVDGEVLLELTVDDLVSIGVPRSATGASCWPRLPPWGRNPRPSLNLRRARHLRQTHLRLSMPSAGS
jgi:SAM domain (Sterile alpha motif)